jgi:dephospho-CoA kinase
MLFKIGITGGIGSGKSVVSHLLRLMGIPVYDCDSESKRLVVESPSIRHQLIQLVGEKLYTASGINKPLLASYIFNNEEHLKTVNSIIHPAVIDDFIRWTSTVCTSSGIVGMESAILIDAGLEGTVDIVINVSAPVELRINRAVARDSSTKEAIRKRIENQLSDEERCLHSQYIITNDDVHALIPQIVWLIDSIKKQFNTL